MWKIKWRHIGEALNKTHTMNYNEKGDCREREKKMKRMK